MITEYPKKIYTNIIPMEDDGNKVYLIASDSPAVTNGLDNIEYTRSDLVGKQTSLPKWHKYPDEKPKEFGDFLVTSLEDNKLSVYIATYDTVYNNNWFTSDDVCITRQVLAWQELPEPYKED